MNYDLGAEHESLGRTVTTIIAKYYGALGGALVSSEATPTDLEKIFDEPLPLEGAESVDEILKRFEQDVLPHAMNIPSPRYYGLFNPAPLPIAVWADALASAINQNGAAWRNSPSANVIQARVIRWLCEVMGYDKSESFGTLCSGGSEANLIGLKCARDRAAAQARDHGVRSTAGGDLTVYASEQCHYSLIKSVDILGLGRNSLRKIPTDDRYRIRLDALREEIEKDLKSDRVPCCVCGAAGATSTGVVDDLAALAQVARSYNVWFHVDAAYGGALSFSGKHKHELHGIEKADSITIDPHKWMFIPIACGAVLVRDGPSVLREAFDITPGFPHC